MTLTDTADEIFRDLEEPSTINVAGITRWLETHLGDLNSALALSITIENGILSEDLTETERSIYKDLYVSHYYGVQIKNNLGASSYDYSELKEGDSQIRRVSRNEIAKTYRGIKKDLDQALKDKIHLYRRDKSLPLSNDAISDLRQFPREDV